MDAPTYYASIVTQPFGPEQYSEASAAAARAAGWPLGSAILPSSPVVVYGPPPLEGPTLPPGMRALYGPAPIGIPGVPLPGFGTGTAPPPPAEALLQRSVSSAALKKRVIRRFRARKGW